MLPSHETGVERRNERGEREEAQVATNNRCQGTHSYNNYPRVYIQLWLQTWNLGIGMGDKDESSCGMFRGRFHGCCRTRLVDGMGVTYEGAGWFVLTKKRVNIHDRVRCPAAVKFCQHPRIQFANDRALWLSQEAPHCNLMAVLICTLPAEHDAESSEVIERAQRDMICVHVNPALVVHNLEAQKVAPMCRQPHGSAVAVCACECVCACV
jgi:hypothetical protein